MKLRGKIIAVLVLGILMTFTPLLYIMQTKVKSANMERIEMNTQKLVDSKSNEIGLWLNQRISEIRVIHELDSVQDMDLDAIKDYVDKLNHSSHIKDRSSHETFAIGATDGLGYISKDFYIDISQRQYFKEVMNSDLEYIISDPVTSRSDSMPIFLISYPIVNSNLEKVGFINGSVSLEKVASIAREIDLYDGYSWIMNKNKNIYSDDFDKKQTDIISEKALTDVVDHFETETNGHIKVANNKGQNSTIFFAAVPHAEDWILCTMIDDSAINAQNNAIINIILRIGALFILISILLAIAISGSLAGPINQLSYNMNEVSKGNLNSYFKVHGDDEINMLGAYFNDMVDNIKELINKVYNVEQQKRKAELKTLQAQVNPHFLYNTLDTVQWKALEHDNYEVADLISSLSGFFRIALSDGKEFITIADEIKHVTSYLEIQQVRYEDILDYEISYDDSLLNHQVPKLITQPLVENAIYHGIKQNRQKGLIIIDIYQQEGNIFISVEDNGVGIDSEKLAEIKHNLNQSIESDHYGLYNVNERLKLFFGDDFKIDIQSTYHQGTTVILKIPQIEEGLDV